MTTMQHEINKPYLVPNIVTNRNLTVTVTVKAWTTMT